MTDIDIEMSDSEKLWTDPVPPSNYYAVKNNRVFYYIHGTAVFAVEGGNKIVVAPLPGADQDVIRLYVLGSCMGAALFQRGILPLHGSAVAIHGKAYAFVGESGAGKSTLAASLLSHGYHFLSDDVIAVTMPRGGDAPVVIPSYPQQKLWQESLDHLGMDTNEYRPLFEEANKFTVPVMTRFNREPLPLAGIYELAITEHHEVNLRPIEGLQRLRVLLSHTYRGYLLQPMKREKWHFAVSALIARQTKLYRLTRPAAPFTLHDLTAKILQTITEEVRDD